MSSNGKIQLEKFLKLEEQRKNSIREGRQFEMEMVDYEPQDDYDSGENPPLDPFGG